MSRRGRKSHKLRLSKRTKASGARAAAADGSMLVDSKGAAVLAACMPALTASSVEPGMHPCARVDTRGVRRLTSTTLRETGAALLRELAARLQG